MNSLKTGEGLYGWGRHFSGLFLLCVTLLVSGEIPAQERPVHKVYIRHQLTVSESKGKWKISHHQEYSFVRLPGAAQEQFFGEAHQYSGMTVRNFRPVRNGIPVKSDKLRVTLYNTDYDTFLSDDKREMVLFDTPFVANEVYGYQFDVTYDHPAYLPSFIIPNYGELTQYEILVNHPAGVSASLELGEPNAISSVEVDSSLALQTRFVIQAVRSNGIRVGNPFSNAYAMAILTITSNGVPITPSHPNEFVKWYGSELDLTPDLPPTLALAMKDTIPDGASPRETLARIHDWVRTHIRYLADDRGRHTIFPTRPDSTLNLRYGDCKDRAYLVMALARSRSLRAYMGLVDAGWNPAFEHCSVSLFNHVISVFTINDSLHFSDATQRFAPFEQLNSVLGGNQLLLLDEENGRYITIPPPPGRSELTANFSMHIDSLTDARLHLECRGDYLLLLRDLQLNTPQIEQQALLRVLLTWELGDFRIREPRISSDSAGAISIDAQADLSRFLVHGANGLYISAVIWPRLSDRLPERARDSLPIQIFEPLSYDVHFMIRGASVPAPDSLILTCQSSALYESQIDTFAPHVLEVSYRHELHESMYQDHDKNEFLKYLNDLISSKKRLFALKRDI